jgi:hypothetical protein
VADPTITDKAVDEAARATYGRTWTNHLRWDEIHPDARAFYLTTARAALEAALPHLPARQSADRDTETAALRAAVAEIAELRANWVDDYVKRAQKRWRESSWTSAEADRIEQEAIQKWNARHLALIALWRRHEQTRASLRGGE